MGIGSAADCGCAKGAQQYGVEEMHVHTLTDLRFQGWEGAPGVSVPLLFLFASVAQSVYLSHKKKRLRLPARDRPGMCVLADVLYSNLPLRATVQDHRDTQGQAYSNFFHSSNPPDRRLFCHSDAFLTSGVSPACRAVKQLSGCVFAVSSTHMRSSSPTRRQAEGVLPSQHRPMTAANGKTLNLVALILSPSPSPFRSPLPKTHPFAVRTERARFPPWPPQGLELRPGSPAPIRRAPPHRHDVCRW